MKRSLCLFTLCVMVSAISWSQPQKKWQREQSFKIEKLSTPTIVIDRKVCKVGSTFTSVSSIQWSSPKQGMWAKGMTTLERYHFTRESFMAKKAKSVREYFNKTNHPSVRALDGDSDFVLKVSPERKKFKEKRIALIIGNSNYQYLGPLMNPINDATEISLILDSLGFDTYTLYDLGYEDLKTAINKFSGKAKSGGYDVALFYFAGHGLQDDGHNYLIPIDGILDKRSDLRFCVEGEDVLEVMERTGCAAKFVFFDACRNVKTHWDRGDHDGLATMEPKNGTVLMYSTGQGRYANDGDDERESQNSPFAKAFVDVIGVPSSHALTTINAISFCVIERTKNMKYQQIPFIGFRTLPDFSFNPIVNQPAKPVSNVVPAPTIVSPSSSIVSNDVATIPIDERVKLAIKDGKWDEVERMGNGGVAGAADVLAMHYLNSADNLENNRAAEKWANKASDKVRKNVRHILYLRGYLINEE